MASDTTIEKFINFADEENIDEMVFMLQTDSSLWEYVSKRLLELVINAWTIGNGSWDIYTFLEKHPDFKEWTKDDAREILRRVGEEDSEMEDEEEDENIFDVEMKTLLKHFEGDDLKKIRDEYIDFMRRHDDTIIAGHDPTEGILEFWNQLASKCKNGKNIEALVFICWDWILFSDKKTASTLKEYFLQYAIDHFDEKTREKFVKILDSYPCVYREE